MSRKRGKRFNVAFDAMGKTSGHPRDRPVHRSALRRFTSKMRGEAKIAQLMARIK